MTNWFKRRNGLRIPEAARTTTGPRNPALAVELIDAGIAAEGGGDLIEAERLFRAAVAADRMSASAHMNLGIALQGKGEMAAAAQAHAEAVNLDPTLASAHYNLARARLDLEDVARAEPGFREALRLRPEFPEAWVGLAEVLESTARGEEALAALDRAIAQRPDYVGALFNAALLLRRMGRLDDAEARLRNVPRDHPEFSNAMIALAATLRDLGRVDEALLALRTATQASSNPGAAPGELLFTLCFSDKISEQALFAEHAEAGARTETEAKSWSPGFSNTPVRDRVLNIGYLSGDFRRHSVALFIEFLFERHRRDRVRIYAYSSTPEHDEVTERFIAGSDVWRDLRGEPDAAAAALILNDGIDILIDLSGHTSPSRIGVLAGRAAPVQMTWMGCNNTTGLTRVDYRISDPVSDPPGLTESLHTEQLLRMPHCQWCFRPPADVRGMAPVRDSTVAAFTFGALNQFAKVSASTIDLWVDVLRAIPASRLRVGNVPTGRSTQTLVKRLEDAGIDRSRFDLFNRVSQADYYRHYEKIDACLDATPYSGCTTTCDALWFGVPVVTLAGSRSVSRSTASLLMSIDMPDLIAGSREEFVAIATRLASRGHWPNVQRAALRKRFAASPLMDEQQFTEDLETLYRRAWRTWCDRPH